MDGNQHLITPFTLRTYGCNKMIDGNPDPLIPEIFMGHKQGIISHYLALCNEKVLENYRQHHARLDGETINREIQKTAIREGVKLDLNDMAQLQTRGIPSLSEPWPQQSPTYSSIMGVWNSIELAIKP